ncbi:trypsin-like serine protease [Arthrobacter sp. 3Tela_A]|uniref:trypsin-like serine protease n=1 Tax=Arthrobacter sp. 3Tela_A TaxID=3093743 RepID=UPI003BB674EF
MKRAARVLPVPVRAAAAAAALAAGGFLVGVPAQAAPGVDAPPEQPAAAAETSGTTLPPGLAEALQRDLGMTEEEFQAAGEAGQRAAAALPQLQATPGFAGLELQDGEILIYGSGAELEQQAEALGARLLAPAEPVETAPAENDAEESGDAAPADPAIEPVTEESAETEQVPAAGEEPPAAEATQPTRTASDLTALTLDYIASFGVEGLQSVGLGANGYTISVEDPEEPRPAANARMSAAATPATPADFASSYANVTVKESAGAGTPLAEEVFGGQGYYGEAGAGGYASCSIGFNGWDPEGNPAVITAGHCTGDGTVSATLLAPDAEGEAPTTELGTFGTSIFGGPGNSSIDPENPDPAAIGTDIAVINSVNEDLDLLPEVTEWNSAGLSETTTRITGTGTAVAGLPVCRSGLTTGWKCGTVTELGIFLVAGHDNASNPDDVRAVMGFMSNLEAAPGDSGGPVIAGSTALGLVSAGFPNSSGSIDTVGAADLTDALRYTPGYSIATFMEAPALNDVKDGDTVYTDQVLSGTAPAGSVVRISLDDAGSEIPAGADGTWSMQVPRTVTDGETVRISVSAASGFNKSRTTVYNLVTAHSALDAPVLLSPTDGSSSVGAFSTIEGLAEPGATVEIELGTAQNGEAESARALAASEAITVTADGSGTFSAALEEPLTPGTYSLAATQDGITGKTVSAAAAAAFSVLHPAPAITSVRNGEVFTEASAPRTISGTGIAGAALTLSTGEADSETVVAEDGTWSLEVAAFAPGEFTVTAVQELDGVGSAPATATFQVTALQAAAVTRTPGGLASTGADGGSLTAVLSAAGVLLLGGAAGVGYSRRRSTH